jgi:protein-S-isoprenylcysteine O-methyltransferase Ste14
MLVVIVQVLGVFAFIVGILILKKWLGINPSKEVAEKTSKISHFLIYSGLILPFIIGVIYPGLTRFDEVLGIRSLPFRSVAFILGVFLLLAGVYPWLASQRAIKYLGSGAPAFKLTKQIVEGDVYRRVRNPMSLGWYLICIGISLMAGSTYLTLYFLLGHIPAHTFYLKYFEEAELEIRFGQSYLQYKQKVPFLIPRFIYKE